MKTFALKRSKYIFSFFPSSFFFLAKRASLLKEQNLFYFPLPSYIAIREEDQGSFVYKKCLIYENRFPHDIADKSICSNS